MISLLLWQMGAVALAQESPDINAQLYRFPIDSQYTLWADEAGTAPDGYYLARLGLGYVRNPLVYQEAVTGEETAIVGGALSANVFGGVSWSRIRLGLDIPLYLATQSDLDNVGGAGLGDIAIDLKGSILPREDEGVGLALDARINTPTATVNTALGNPGAGVDLTAILDHKQGPMLVALNLGTRIQPESQLENVTWNDQMIYRLGMGYEVTEDGGFSADVAGLLNYSESIANQAATPSELLLGGWGRAASSIVIRGGVGTGLSRGIGSPDLRTLLVVGYEPSRVRDLDGDGIVDKLDACVDKAEDKDNYKDEDGCPDPTTRMRVKVVNWRGDALNSATVVVNTPGEPRKGNSGLELDLNPGSYQVVVSADRYASSDQFITVPEQELFETVVSLNPNFGGVRVRVKDSAGNPLDGTFLIDGKNPTAFKGGVGASDADVGEHNIVVQSMGFKNGKATAKVVAKELSEVELVLDAARVIVTKEKIDLKGTIYFDTGKATIKAESFPLLDDVAAVLKENPDIKKVSIEGHTDSRGSASANRKLSDARAASVKAYLVSKGVEAERLSSIGYGEDRPVDKRENAEAWDKNRRVDFMIVERAPQ
jgi:OmpA-OmpF porin, OOP family